MPLEAKSGYWIPLDLELQVVVEPPHVGVGNGIHIICKSNIC